MDFSELSKRYTGGTAAAYNDTRIASEKWQREQEAMRSILALIERGSKVLDVPVGTGRFVSMYQELGLNLTGMDISQDMLDQAAAAASAHGLKASFQVADIRRLPVADNTFDATVCIRFLNWIETPLLQDVVRELARVSVQHLIVGVRHLTPQTDMIVRRQGLARWVAQKFGRTRHTPSKSGLVFHPKAAVTGVFHDLGLTVEDSHGIDRRSDGTEYFIYRLAKA